MKPAGDPPPGWALPRLRIGERVRGRVQLQPCAEAAAAELHLLGRRARASPAPVDQLGPAQTAHLEDVGEIAAEGQRDPQVGRLGGSAEDPGLVAHAAVDHPARPLDLHVGSGARSEAR